jgi:Mg-chelatase subunit ChlD
VDTAQPGIASISGSAAVSGAGGGRRVVTAVDLNRLELLGSAIAGAPLSVASAEPGQTSWTDGAAVFVDESLRPVDQMRAVAIQAALLASGSLAPEIVGDLARRGRITQRYLAIEGHRALAEHGHVVPPAARTLIDQAVAGRSASPAESLAIARGKEPVTDAPALFGSIHPRQVRAGKANGPEEEAARHVPRQTRQQVLQELDDGEDTETDGGFDLFNPVGGSGVVGRLLQRLLGNSRSKGKGSPGAEAATHRTKNAGRVAKGAAVSSTRAELAEELEELGRGEVTYPEWNFYTRRYRPDWCTVSEIEATVAATEVTPGPESARLRRSIARLGLDLERRRRQPQGDDIDIDATVEARVELAAGTAPDENIYIDSVRRRRELSVLVLLDISGSAGEPSDSGGSVHDHQLATATALTQALHQLGDRVALYGFRSQGRTAVQVVPVKRFAERFDSLTLRRLNGLVPGGYTRLGAGIRHGSAVLEADGGTVRRLLVVLSDGFAYDHGYEGDYGEADARRALAEARRRGTGCLCLSIGAGLDADSLRRVFGTAAHASFPRVGQLTTTAGPLFRSALRLAEMQRRTSQRNERTRERLLIERRSA